MWQDLTKMACRNNIIVRCQEEDNNAKKGQDWLLQPLLCTIAVRMQF